MIAGRLRADRFRVRLLPGAAPLRTTYGAGLNAVWVVAVHSSQAKAAREALASRDSAGILHPEDFSDPVTANWRQMKRSWRWIVVGVLAIALYFLLAQLG
ncbi:MAG: hypothetical protein ACKVVT_08390 [Dehalococcoidia bacterium]